MLRGRVVHCTAGFTRSCQGPELVVQDLTCRGAYIVSIFHAETFVRKNGLEERVTVVAGEESICAFPRPFSVGGAMDLLYESAREVGEAEVV